MLVLIASSNSKENYQYFYHPDHLGSSSYLTDVNGDVSQHVEYLPYGELFLEERNNKWNTSYLFNAKELDEETGLYYVSQRYHDPKINIWLSVDQLRAKYPNISSYAFCAGNPVKYVDPDGRDWFENTKTGALYFNNNYSKNDVSKIEGNNWEWFGENNIFVKNKRDYENAFINLVEKYGGENRIVNDKLLSTIEINDTEKAKSFMSDRGYEFKPTQQVRFESEINFEQASGTHVTTGEKTYITEKSGYVPKGSIENIYTPLNDVRYKVPATVNRFKIEYTTNIIAKALNFIQPFIGYHDMRIPTVYPSLSAYAFNNELINVFLRDNPQPTRK